MPSNKLILATLVTLIANWPLPSLADSVSRDSAAFESQPVTVIPAVTKAWQMADLHSRATGIVDEVYVEIGDAVSRGDILLTINDPLLDTELRILQAELKEAEAGHKLNELDFNRSKRLLEDNLISASDNDRLQAKVEKSEAFIDAISAKIARKKVQQTFLTIRAPFDGHVINREVEKGDLVMSDNKAGRALFKIADLRRLRIQYRVPQGVSYQIDNGDGVEFTAKSYDKLLNTSVSLISKDIDESFGTVLMESWINNESLELPSGLRGEVEISGRQKRP
tara:strand:+ start:362 stop:1201 length:840 start_codon:yes stop_codon:yes gene_type:complete